MRAVKRGLAAALLAVAALSATPASAAPPTPGGYCEGKVDLTCREDNGCVPDLPCNIDICLVWYSNACLV
jgi:hypothetical protein